jgi:hypothetical protein
MFAVYFLMPIVFAGIILPYLLYIPITVTCIRLSCEPPLQRYWPSSPGSTLYIIRDDVFTFPYLAPCWSVDQLGFTHFCHWKDDPCKGHVNVVLLPDMASTEISSKLLSSKL